MKFSFLIFIFFIVSCTSNTTNKSSSDPYNATGFALLYNKEDFKNKIISSKLDNSKLEIAHSRIKKNSIVKITNLENKKSIELKVTKNINYPNFFKILITEKVANKLDLKKDLPYVDIQEKFRNKSFVAKKAVTFTEEQKVSNTAPVTKVKIDNISSIKETKIKKNKKFFIIVGDFYLEDSALNLKNTLEKNYVNKGTLRVKKLAKNKFILSAGPYSTINSLKKDYFELNKYGFEDLDVKHYD
tara:strand:+ start:580 stop:1308 length:729 start_codon:yes stop_codon:yes gene_type:complete